MSSPPLEGHGADAHTTRRHGSLPIEPAPPTGVRAERGAIAVLAAVCAFVLVALAAFAIDMGSWLEQGADLQSTADAAALAGALELDASGGDMVAVRAEVERVVRLNGLDTTGLSVSVTRVDATTVGVAIENPSVDLFFSGLLVDSVSLRRDAQATLDRCGATCVQTLEIPRPFTAVAATGSGDGYIPILVDGRLYAVNHHIGPGADVICLDRDTRAMCSGYPKDAESSTGAADLWTSNTPSAVVVGRRFFYSAQRANDFGLACWDTVNDRTCGYKVLTNATIGSRWQHYARGGAVTLVGGRVYVYSDDRRWHCVEPATLALCAGYPVSSGLVARGVPAYNVAHGGPLLDSEVIAGRIYAIVEYNASQNAVGTYLFCHDTATASPCSGFGTSGVVTLSDDGNWSEYEGERLFLRLDSALQTVGICRLTRMGHQCFDLAGNGPKTVPGLNGALTKGGGGMRGPTLTHMGRTYFNGGFLTSATNCWDWATSSSCGTLVGNIAGVATEDYGYAAEGRCIYALGDNSIFWTFDRDMQPGCRSGTASIDINPCTCGDGTAHWGDVRITGDLTAAGPFEEFAVRVLDPAGTELMARDLIDTDGSMSLDTIATTHAYLTIEVSVTAKVGQDPWASGDVPVIEVGWRDSPFLAD